MSILSALRRCYDRQTDHELHRRCRRRPPLALAGPFQLTEVSRAPIEPGIYVWYGKLLLGKADVASRENMSSLLESFSARFERQRLKVEARWNFNLGWSGEMDSDGPRRCQWGSADEEVLGPASRQLAAQLLLAAQHVFFQPLYIGKAEVSLRTRLGQHSEEFLRLRGFQSETGVLPKGEDDFAQRAAKLGFSEDQLVCYAMTVDGAHTLPEPAVRTAIALAETYLNSWATPLLGRK